jgi:hypothetical protein
MSRRRATTRDAIDPSTTSAAAIITKIPKPERNAPKKPLTMSVSLRVSSQSFVPARSP